MKIRSCLALVVALTAAVASPAFPQNTVQIEGEAAKAQPAIAPISGAAAATAAGIASTPAPEAPELHAAPPAVPSPASAAATAPAAATAVEPATGVKEAALIAPEPPALRQRLEEIAPAPKAKTAEPTPGEILYNQTHDLSFMDPKSWAVTIHKSQHELLVYYKGRRFRQYQAVFGRRLIAGTKEYANDRRTPEGVYTVIGKHRSRRFDWFLKLNYPNLLDRERYAELKSDHMVPVDDDGAIAGVGGAIGIHGTDVPLLNEGLINWTTGCISVSNKSIDELAHYLPVGTVVIIKP